MVLHNTMEDLVLNYLDEILENKKNICKCNYCRIDMAAYALNRIKPMYVVSSRGIIHTENIKRKNIQDEIDVYSIAAEAVDIISSSKRHEINHEYNINENIDPCVEYIKKFKEGEIFFNFPQIVGRVFDGLTIKNLDGVKITLYNENGEQVTEMCNKRWQNPVTLLSQMEGTFTFWPAPIQAKKTKIQKDFYFNIEVNKEGYEPFRKYFMIRLISDNILRHNIKKENIYYVDDLYITEIKTEN